MSQSIDAMVNAAIATIGAHETNGNNVNYITSWYGEDGQPWCNMAVTYWAYHSNNVGPVCFGYKHDYTVEHAQTFADHGQWHTDVAGIRRGDIVFFDWNGSNSIAAIDHVGLVESVDADGTVHTIEGNIDNVCKRMLRYSNYIVGYGRPSYAADPAGPAPTPDPTPTPTGSTYTVVAGDTLSAIATRLGVSLADLLAVNPQITNPDEIDVGQVINVPSAPAPTPPPPTPTPTPTPAPLPNVSCASVRAASAGGQSDIGGTTLVVNALEKLGYHSNGATGEWTRSTTYAYSRFQHSLGFTGSDANGHPGITSLTQLGKRSDLFIATP